MQKASPDGRAGGTGSPRKSLRRLIVLSTAAGFAGVLIFAAFVLKDRIIEELELRVVERGAPGEQVLALARLLERGSMRAVPHLLDQVLDPALERRLEAIHALRVERSGGLEAEDTGPFRQRSFLGEIEFAGVDRDTLEFLRSPWLRPAVRFGCVPPHAPYDEALEDALEDGRPAVRAQALAVLLRVRAPSSVEAQWKALEAMRCSRSPEGWRPVLERMAESFEASRLLAEMAAKPPRGEYDDPPSPFAWSIRAAGVTRLDRAIPRLRELSTWSNLDTTLAAKRSLVDFEGPEAPEVPDEARAALHRFEERFPLAERRR